LGHRRKDPAARKKAAPKKPRPVSKPAPKPVPTTIEYMTAQAIGNELGVNRRTVREWFDRGCPAGPVSEVIAWRDANIKLTRATFANRFGGPAPAPEVDEGQMKRGQLLELQTREAIKKTQTETQLRLFQLREKHGEMVERALVQRQVAAIYVRIKERLLACSDEMETEFPAETRVSNKRVLDEFLRRVLMEVSLSVVSEESVDDLVIAEAANILASREADEADDGEELPDESGDLLDEPATIAE